MTSWRDIQDNDAIFQKLAATVAGGETLAFVGAGASAGLYPLWPRLIEELIAEAVLGLHESERAGTAAYWREEASKAPEQVAQDIRRGMKEGPFAEFIAKRFGPKRDEDGRRFTPTHATLARLPLAGYVTTNYDPALETAFGQERPTHTLSRFSWHDDDVSRWIDGRGFGEDVLPLLYAHGRYNEASRIVLAVDSYREIYSQDGPYLRLFDQLWTTTPMLFVGFSFSDAWLAFLADRSLHATRVKRVAPPRHVAIVPLDVSKMDQSHVRRKRFRRQYHAEAVFYPVTKTADGAHDHNALQILLADLEAAVAAKRDAFVRTPVQQSAPDPDDPAQLIERWCAEVCADHARLLDFFPGRPKELEILEQAWVRLHVTLPTAKDSKDDKATVDAPKVFEARDVERRTLESFLELEAADHPWVTRRWLVVGEPGSGKTTLIRHLAARLAEDEDRAWVPLFVPLAKLVDPDRNDRDVLRYVQEEFEGLLGQGIADALDDAGRRGTLLLLLDGFDEVPPEYRQKVRRLLRKIDRDWPDATALLTSRPLGLDQGRKLKGFVHLSLLSLHKEERLRFLEAWFGKRPGVDATAEAAKAAQHFDRERSLRRLSLNPMHLTLLTVLWESGERALERRSEVMRAILGLLLSGEIEAEATKVASRAAERGPLEPEEAARETLRFIAYGMTESDRWAEPIRKLTDRLLDPALDGARARIETVWGKQQYRRFLQAVYERTFILGPHDSQRADWRFWHRTFREALCAEQMRADYDAKGENALLARVEKIGGDLGRWAEPLSLLVGQVSEPNALMRRLMEVNRDLGVRALATADGLAPDTLIDLLGLAEGDLIKRREIFLAVPDQLEDPDRCLALVDQLRPNARDGNDLFFLEWIVDEVATRWPDRATVADEIREHLFDHLPTPEGARELFIDFETAKGESPRLWCTIPNGRGIIGSRKGQGHDYERPQHAIEVAAPYALAAVPITRAQYRAFDPSKEMHRFEGIEDDDLDHHPAIDVTWYGAVAFCRWLDRRLGFRDARLPTEEEWEHACRGTSDADTEYWSGDGKKALREIGWFDDNSERRTHRVAEKEPNPLGLYDVHGNVWEWTISEWDGKRYKDRSSTDPFPVDPRQLPADLAATPGVPRVLRGGSCWSSADGCRSAFRYHWLPVNEFRYLGFRVLLPRPPETLDP